ncbi:MAG: response regulator [Desulfobacterales bacterium]|nr:response regulator [Desulfobacterales bacterium]
MGWIGENKLKSIAFGGLRTRLLCIVLMVIFPMAGLLVYHEIERRNENRIQVLAQTSNLARNASVLLRRTILEAHQTLFTLSQLPQFHQQDSALSSKAFAALLIKNKAYTSLTAVRANGDVFAAVPANTKPLNFSDRKWFRRVIETRNFVIGEYLFGRLVNRPIIVLGYPVVDPAGQITSVLAMGLDLEHMQKTLQGADLPAGATLTVVDSAGTIVIRNPDLKNIAGKKMPEHPRIKAMFVKRQGAEEMPGLDGTVRLHGYTTIGRENEALYLSISLPVDFAYAKVSREAARELALFWIVSALALLGAWFLGGRLITSPVSRLIDVTKQVSAGDLTARAGLPGARGEIGLLASQFDSMAESLQRREKAQKLAEETLRESEEKHRNLYAQSRQQNQALSALSDISQTVNQSLDLDQILIDTIDKVVELFQCHSSMLRFFDEQTRELVHYASKGLSPEELKIARQRLKEDGSFISICIKSGRVETIEDMDTDPRVADTMGYVKSIGIRSLAFLPLYIQQKLVGTMSIRYLEPRIYTAEEIQLFTSIGNMVGTAIENARLYQDREDTIRKLKETQGHLQQAQKMEAIGTLAGGVAHDFNNLLTTILGNADLVLMGIDRNDPAREGLEEIKKAGHRAASLTRQLLAFSRKQVIRPVVLDLNQALGDLGKMLRRLIQENIELQFIPAPFLPYIKMDPGQIEQVAMNLAVNARDAMPDGGKLTIETAKTDLDEGHFHKRGMKPHPGPYVMLAVSDTGSGIDKETQERIFEPFFTTKEIGKGTGLGMATVYGIVKQNKGYIWVYSEPGQGTTFKIYLPAVKGDAAPEKEDKTPARPPGGSETVLIVEDDPALRDLSYRILHDHGYSVLAAENGENALRIIKEHEGKIDLLLTDVVMPKMSGKEVAARLQPVYPRMKVLYMSGYPDEIITRDGMLTPGLNFLEKPFTAIDLAQKVRQVLDNDPVGTAV